ncbi:acetyltransferase family protein, partial [Vibrio cholerae HC-37A1]
TPQEGLSTRGVSSPIEPRWLLLLCLSLVVVRCQPLRRALGIWRYHESYLFDSLLCFIKWLLGHARISKTSVGF